MSIKSVEVAISSELLYSNDAPPEDFTLDPRTRFDGATFDPLILVIPSIITARAVSHTVQMAERFFEDYEILVPTMGDPEAAKYEAATVAMSELIVPGTLCIVTDVAGLLVILVTSMPQMRDLGVFGAFWVASIISHSNSMIFPHLRQTR